MVVPPIFWTRFTADSTRSETGMVRSAPKTSSPLKTSATCFGIVGCGEKLPENEVHKLQEGHSICMFMMGLALGVSPSILRFRKLALEGFRVVSMVFRRLLAFRRRLAVGSGVERGSVSRSRVRSGDLGEGRESLGPSVARVVQEGLSSHEAFLQLLLQSCRRRRR